MTDRLVELAANPAARKWIGRLGLPVPMPQKLRRAEGPSVERPLADRRILVGGAGGLTGTLAQILPAAGADPVLEAVDPAAFHAAGEAWGRPPEVLSGLLEGKVEAMVFDATHLSTPDHLKAVYDFFHPVLKQLARCGRAVVIGRPVKECKKPAHAATQRALEGFVRSLGRELGRKGSTANLITVATGAEARLGATLRFVLSDDSAYISGQPFHVSKTVRSYTDEPVRALDTKVVLVTGAARGIGRATAIRLAAEGAHVIVLDRPEDAGPAAEVAQQIGGSVFLADVTAPDTAERLVAHIQSEHGKLDVVVHNAGVTRDKTLAKMKPELWDLTLGVNLVAVVTLTEALRPLLAERARIICLSSIAGIAGNVGQTNYSASKAGIIGFVRASAPGFARRGIAINAVAPGFIETRLTDAIPVATREVARRLCSLSQGGLPLDIANTINYLASPGAAGLCGQTLRVCGGSFVGA